MYDGGLVSGALFKEYGFKKEMPRHLFLLLRGCIFGRGDGIRVGPWSSRIVGRVACSRRKNIGINQGKSESHPERRTTSAVEHGVRHEVSGSLIDRLSQTPHPSRFTRHLVSLRLGHGSALTVVQTVIHSLADASLPAGEGLQRTDVRGDPQSLTCVRGGGIRGLPSMTEGL